MSLISPTKGPQELPLELPL